jgi:hypothetical protein
MKDSFGGKVEVLGDTDASLAAVDTSRLGTWFIERGVGTSDEQLTSTSRDIGNVRQQLYVVNDYHVHNGTQQTPFQSPSFVNNNNFKMAVLSLPLSFSNSFWSQDYRRGLETLFGKLEQVPF